MKQFKKALTAAIAMLMVLGLATPVFAEGEIKHTITIDDTDQNVSHKFEAYQVFAGNLDKDGQGTKLSNIEWGTGVDGSAILKDLKAADVDPALKATAQIVIDKAKKDKFADEDAAKAAGFKKKEGAADGAEDYWIKTIEAGDSLFKYCTTAQDVAAVISGFTSTGRYDAQGNPTTNPDDGGVSLKAGQIDAFATIVGNHLATKAADFKETDEGKKYTAEVNGDGYYFIKDATTDEKLVDDDTTASDSRSKYLLAIVKDTKLVAKDTGLKPDKKLLDKNDQKVAANSKAIGDTVNFVVTVEVPNTKKYEDHFIFVMNDTLPEGITFTGITSVEINGTALSDLAKEETAPDFDNYEGNKGYYTLKLSQKTNDGYRRFKLVCWC